MEGPLAWINGHPLCEQEQPHGKRDGKYEGLWHSGTQIKSMEHGFAVSILQQHDVELICKMRRLIIIQSDQLVWNFTRKSQWYVFGKICLFLYHGETIENGVFSKFIWRIFRACLPTWQSLVTKGVQCHGSSSLCHHSFGAYHMRMLFICENDENKT